MVSISTYLAGTNDCIHEVWNWGQERRICWIHFECHLRFVLKSKGTAVPARVPAELQMLGALCPTDPDIGFFSFRWHLGSSFFPYVYSLDNIFLSNYNWNTLYSNEHIFKIFIFNWLMIGLQYWFDFTFWWMNMIAYGERCWICHLWRFNFRTRDQAWSLKSFVEQSFIKV